MRVDADAAQKTTRALAALRATRFVPAQPNVGSRVIEVDEARLAIGGACPGHAGETVVWRAGDGAWLCLADSELAKVSDPALALDRRLVAGSAADVVGVHIVRGGREVGLARQDGRFRLTSPAGSRVAADSDAVRDWLDGLVAFTATGFVPVRADEALPDATVLTLEFADGRRDMVRFGAVRGEVLPGRRDGEPQALALPAALADQLVPDPLLFRTRTALHFARADARGLTVKRAIEQERVEQGEGASWRVTAPVAVEADAEVVDRVLSQLSDLRAERFVPAPLPGALTGARTLTIETAAPGEARARHEVRVAAASGAHSCAAEADGLAFWLAAPTCVALDERFATHTLLDVAEDKLSRVELMPGARAFEKRGSGWFAGDEPVNAAGIDALMAALRGLAARDVVGYGRSAWHRERAVTVTTADGTRATVEVGPRKGVGERLARLVGRDVTYRVSEQAVDAVFRKPASTVDTN
jgi:hypothetical protein